MNKNSLKSYVGRIFLEIKAVWTPDDSSIITNGKYFNTFVGDKYKRIEVRVHKTERHIEYYLKIKHSQQNKVNKDFK